MSTDEQLILTNFDENQICTITFNRPKSLNALNVEVLENFKEALLSIKGTDTLGVILTGAGEKSFIAGADIKEMLSMGTEEASRFSLLGQEVTTIMEEMETPIIACVNGFAFGGGLEMALGADFIYCSENAIFGLPEVKLGLIPGFGGTQRLARVVGRNIAREAIYTGRNITAKEAVSIGLVNRSFENIEELLREAKKTLCKMQNNSIYAIGKAKLATLRGVDLDLKIGLETEKDIFSSLFNSHDAKEGTQAFADKRQANFQHMKGE